METPILDTVINVLLGVAVHTGLLLFCWGLASRTEDRSAGDIRSAGEGIAVSERTEVRFEQEENQKGLSAESTLPQVKMIIVDEAVQLAELGVEPQVVEAIVQQSASQVRHTPTQPKPRKRRSAVPTKAGKGFA